MSDTAAPQFGTFLRAAGKLAAARQLAALVFVGAVLALPLLTPGRWVTDFVWAYFVVLTLTSVLGFGFERLAGSLAVRGDSAPIGTLVLARGLTIPIVVAGQWLLLTFVGVSLAPVAWAATLVWTVAALLGPIAYGALRTQQNSTTEPLVVLVTRLVQFAALVSAAASGASVGVALVLVATCEVVGTAVALNAVGPAVRVGVSFGALGRLPWRQAGELAAVEVVALAYLRADLLLVGRMLGPAIGATYGMLYRVVDGLNGTVGSAGLWLYAETVSERDVDSERGLRVRSLRVLPVISILVGVLMVVGSELLSWVFPGIAGEATTLALLIAAFPLLTVNTIELHVRSAQGRNRDVVMIGLVALATNILLCLALVPSFGMHGAALALIGSELLQTVLLWIGVERGARSMLGRAMLIASGGVVGLLLLGVVLESPLASVVLLVASGIVGAVALIARRVRRSSVVAAVRGPYGSEAPLSSAMAHGNHAVVE